MMLDILSKVEFVHDDGHHSDHPGINGSHMPGGVATLTGSGDYVVGGVQLESLNLNTMTVSIHHQWFLNLYVYTSGGAVADVRKFSTVSRAFTPALPIGSCKM